MAKRILTAVVGLLQRGAAVTQLIFAAERGETVDARAFDRVGAAGQRKGWPVGTLTSRETDAPEWIARGATLFLLDSDHGFMLAGAAKLGADVRGGGGGDPR